METAPPDLNSGDHLCLWDAIRADTHSRATVDLLLKLEASNEPVFNRLLCYVHDVAVYKLGDVYLDLPPTENPEHYFVATLDGCFLDASLIASTATQDEAFGLAVTQLRLMETYLRAHVAATAT